MFLIYTKLLEIVEKVQFLVKNRVLDLSGPQAFKELNIKKENYLDTVTQATFRL